MAAMDEVKITLAVSCEISKVELYYTCRKHTSNDANVLSESLNFESYFLGGLFWPSNSLNYDCFEIGVGLRIY